MAVCNHCGDCCRTMRFGPVQFKSNRPAWVTSSIDWAESHGPQGKYTFIKEKDGWYFVVNEKCRYLSIHNTCLRQANKPLVCVEYDCVKGKGGVHG